MVDWKKYTKSADSWRNLFGEIFLNNEVQLGLSFAVLYPVLGFTYYVFITKDWFNLEIITAAYVLIIIILTTVQTILVKRLLKIRSDHQNNQ